MDTTSNAISIASAFVDKNAISLISSHIDWVSYWLVILGGLFAKYYMKDLKAVSLFGKTFSFGTTTKTLVVGTIFITLYIFVMYMAEQLYKEDYTKYFISYCVATSTYQIVIKSVLKRLKIDKDDTK